MIRRTRLQTNMDERAFPVRVRFAVPQGGFGNRILDLHQWLDHTIGRGEYAVHPAKPWITECIAVHLRDVEGAEALVAAFPEFVLADDTQSSTYSSPAQNHQWQGAELFGMCNLYSQTRGQQAIIELARVWEDRSGNLPPLPGIYPDYQAPVVWNSDQGRVLSMMRWGMPSPGFALKNRKTDPGLTNVRNTKSAHWRRWLGVEHRCVVPFTSFAENRKTPHGVEPVWFALDESEPLACFAGIWTEWTSVRKLKEGETTNTLFAFLTTDANAEVAEVHPKAMPVILRDQAELATWLTADTATALQLQRPLPDGILVNVSAPGEEV